MMNHPDVRVFDLALRGGVVLLLLFLAAVLLRDHGRSTAARIGALFAVGVAAYVVEAATGFAWPPAAWQAPMLALAAGNAVMFWIFARALFDDEFKLRGWHGAVWCLLAGAALVRCFVRGPSSGPMANWIGAGIEAATIGFAVMALAQSLSTWRADLVEKRRRLRMFIVAAGTAYTLVSTIARLAGHPGSATDIGRAADALVLAAIVTIIAWHLLRAGSSELFPVGSARIDAAVAVAVASDAADDRHIAEIERLMTVELIYQQQHLTIAAFAQQLGLPEYRLRRLINQRLGHRNFNSFVNRYRLDEAKRMLLDPACSDMAVLSIAMDCGFQSLGPFNRAFKANTGMTPTEFRRCGGRVPETPRPRVTMGAVEG